MEEIHYTASSIEDLTQALVIVRVIRISALPRILVRSRPRLDDVGHWAKQVELLLEL
jgi:hypothetical protein